MTTPETLIAQLTEAIAAIADPADRARAAHSAITAVPTALRPILQDAVLEMRCGEASHADVARELGVTRARAAQIADGR